MTNKQKFISDLNYLCKVHKKLTTQALLDFVIKRKQQLCALTNQGLFTEHEHRDYMAELSGYLGP